MEYSVPLINSIFYESYRLKHNELHTFPKENAYLYNMIVLLINQKNMM
ncbi:hypothetical protein JM81_2404 [Maribacter sp. MAR_2009_72]|nr:hypothetical protein JM81_2404 [Maribacter sp. MAR_2009_72]